MQRTAEAPFVARAMAAGRGELARAPKHVSSFSGHTSTAGLGVPARAAALRLEPVEGYAGHGRLREEFAAARGAGAGPGRVASPAPPRSAGAGGRGVRLEPVEGYAGYGRLREEPAAARGAAARLLRASSSPRLRPPFSRHLSPSSAPSCGSDGGVWGGGRSGHQGSDSRTPSRRSPSVSWHGDGRESWSDGTGKCTERGCRPPTGSNDSIDSMSGLPGTGADYSHPAATAAQLQNPGLRARSRLVSPLIEQELLRPRGLGAQSRGLEATVNAKLLWTLANAELEVPERTQADFRTSCSAMPGCIGHAPTVRHMSNPNTAGAGSFR
ncbi:unnamed protein product [Prorocentrum cordatum]|uniref:Uncharacterized protein n=1 Tax=Prorocentrum cordatum TaxID=2364126 RepID=A0ABN9SFU5_9DINO|nr:unnamed protein product [Polarella glacialis]